MPKFRKKPVEIEAIRFVGHNKDAVENFVGRSLHLELESETAYVAGIAPPIFSLSFDTKEGIMKAFSGDWVIKEPFPTGDRDFYPCKPDIFAKTYEPADAPAPSSAIWEGNADTGINCPSCGRWWNVSKNNACECGALLKPHSIEPPPIPQSENRIEGEPEAKVEISYYSTGDFCANCNCEYWQCKCGKFSPNREAQLKMDGDEWKSEYCKSESSKRRAPEPEAGDREERDIQEGLYAIAQTYPELKGQAGENQEAPDSGGPQMCMVHHALAFSAWNCENLWSHHNGNWYPYQDDDNPISGDDLWELWQKSSNVQSDAWWVALEAEKARNKALQAEISSLKDQLNSKEEEVKAAYENCRTVADRALEYQRETILLKEQVDQMKTEPSSLKDRYAVVTAEWTDEKNSLQAEIASLKERLMAAEIDQHSAESEENRLGELFNDLAHDFADYKKEVEIADGHKNELIADLKTQIELIRKSETSLRPGTSILIARIKKTESRFMEGDIVELIPGLIDVDYYRIHNPPTGNESAKFAYSSIDIIGARCPGLTPHQEEDRLKAHAIAFSSWMLKGNWAWVGRMWASDDYDDFCGPITEVYDLFTADEANKNLNHKAE